MNSAGDRLPGLVADRLDDVLLVQVDSPQLAAPSVAEVQAAVACRAGYVRVRPPHASCRGAELRVSPAWGELVEQVVVLENGVRYELRPLAGQAPGLFFDMREVRAWLREVAAGRQVLNTFAYTCAFGVCATLGGAARVVNLDVSRPSLAWGKANYALNGCPVDERDFVYGDAFDWLRRFARRSEQFDLVIIDPPSFSSTPFSVTRDYPRLVDAAARVVASGGVLLAATNHAATSDARFDAWLADGLARGGRRGHLVRRWHEPLPDFPIPAGQRPYLKVRALALD